MFHVDMALDQEALVVSSLVNCSAVYVISLSWRKALDVLQRLGMFVLDGQSQYLS